MAELIELSPSQHGDLQVAPGAPITIAARQHVVSIRAMEVGTAGCCFPIFFTRSSADGRWAISMMTGIEEGHNLFVRDDRWEAIFMPSGMQTFPLFLMQSDTNEKGYVVGVDPDSDALCKQGGEALYENGKPSLMLNRMTTQLDADVDNDIQTSRFIAQLRSMDLVKEINVQVQFRDHAVQTITGLHTINEDTLLALSAEQLETLNKGGCLLPIYAMLTSIFQLNALIQRHNAIEGNAPVHQLKLEVARDPADLL